MQKPSLCPKCKRLPRRAPGKWCTPCDVSRNRADRGKQRQKKAKAEKMPRFTRALEGAKRYIITSAQNATPIEPEFFAALEVAAKHLGAELVVIPFRYKNPTSIWTKRQAEHEWWGTPPILVGHDENGDPVYQDDPKNPLLPYLFNTRKKLCDTLVLAADVKIQPTASRPLSGFEALTGAESTIIGSPKMQLVSVAAPMGVSAKILTTTGACTRKNYTDTKQGKLGAFHHFLGAIVVEIDGPDFFLFQVNADRETGEFTHHENIYSSAGVRRAPRALGLVQGDTHVRFTDPDVDRATHGPGGIVEVLNPEQEVWHDTLDGYAVNHHHRDDPFIAAAKSKAGFGDIRKEVEQAVDFVRERTKGDRRSVIVASNHDDFLARWLRATDWRTAGVNTDFLLETALAVRRSARMTPGGAAYMDAFAYWVGRLRKGAPIRCLTLKQGYKIGGVDVSNHGHKGPDGSRATMKNLARIGARTFTAHSHHFGIEEGHYKVATSSVLDLEYVAGPSSWRQGHGAIYWNGKRTLLFVIKGKWRLPPPPLPRAGP